MLVYIYIYIYIESHIHELIHKYTVMLDHGLFGCQTKHKLTLTYLLNK